MIVVGQQVVLPARPNAPWGAEICTVLECDDHEVLLRFRDGSIGWYERSRLMAEPGLPSPVLFAFTAVCTGLMVLSLCMALAAAVRG